MRLLKIKKYLFGFILAIILIFVIGLQRINALENKTNIQFNYSEFEEILNNSDEKYRNAITELINYLKKYENDYYINLSFNPSLNSSGVLTDLTSIFFRLVPKTEYFQTNIGINVATKSVAIGNSNSNSYGDSVIVSSQSLYYNSSYAFFFDYDFETYISGLDEKIENANFYSGYNNTILFSFSKNSENIYEMKNINPIYIYSNFDFNFFSNDYDLIIDEKKISNGDRIISFYDYINNQSKIKLSASLAQDLTGTEFYNISAEFNEIYDSTYIYQYKISDGEWTNIADIHLPENSSRIFNYAAYFNLDMSFRVLDSENNVLDENSITISKLSDYGMIISHNFAQDLKGRDIYAITIDLRNCWNENYKYQYSYDNEKYYDMTGLTADNQIFYLNHGINIPIYFRILNENNEIQWSRYYNENFELINKEINIIEFAKTIEGKKMIGLQFDLSQYTQFWQEYEFKIFINGTQQDLKENIVFNYYENNFENITHNLILKIDNLIIEEIEYDLNPEMKEFEDLYEQILEENLSNELGKNDYSTIEGMVDSLNSFIEALKEFIKSFFELAFGFFNKLNIWIRTFIIGIFIIMVICKIIKVVRK